MALKIPAEEIPAIVKMCNLPESAIDELVAALSSSTVVPDSEEMAAQVASSVPSIPIQDLTTILDTLYSLYHIREMSEVSPQRFLHDLVHGIRSARSKELEAAIKTLGGTRPIRDRFQKLLTIDALSAVSKAVALQRSGEHLFCEAKILSDIRPVFPVGDAPVRPTGAVVTHTLKLSYHEEGEHKTFFLIFDSDDLEQLRKTIKRAQDKDKILRSLLKDAKLSELGI